MEVFEPVEVELVAEENSRTIKGLILPFNKVGRTSRGAVSVRPGAVKWSQDLKRVKLLDGHRSADGTAVAVGYLHHIEETEEGLVATFKLGTSANSQTALNNAAEGVVDAMSVELDAISFSPNGKEITAGYLSAVALVPIPAFSDARISEVVAQENTSVDDNHESEGTEMSELENKTPEVTAAEVQAEAPKPEAAAAQAPVGLGHVQVKREPLTLDRAISVIQARLHTGSTSSDLTAAFADITRTANPLVSPDSWVGELWSGVAYNRVIVPQLTNRALTSWKVTGWKWVTKPAVAAYSGDKAAVPSNAADTTSVEASAVRLAGGHDIDRKFIDFNDREFLESYFRAMAESYAVLSDEAALAAVITGATDIEAPLGSDLLQQVAFGANSVRVGTRSGASFVIVNDGDFLDLMSVTASNVPAFLELFGVRPDAFIPHPDVPAGSVIVGTKPAMTFYELGGSPIRVQAEHLANGGRDAAVFGYYATLLHNPAGIVSVTNSLT